MTTGAVSEHSVVRTHVPNATVIAFPTQQDIDVAAAPTTALTGARQVVLHDDGRRDIRFSIPWASQYIRFYVDDAAAFGDVVSVTTETSPAVAKQRPPCIVLRVASAAGDAVDLALCAPLPCGEHVVAFRGRASAPPLRYQFALGTVPFVRLGPHALRWTSTLYSRIDGATDGSFCLRYHDVPFDGRPLVIMDKRHFVPGAQAHASRALLGGEELQVDSAMLQGNQGAELLVGVWHRGAPPTAPLELEVLVRPRAFSDA
jgi:hypothetical protein